MTSQAVATIEPPKAQLIAGRALAPIIPTTVEEVWRLAGMIIKAGLAPASYEDKQTNQPSPEKIAIGIMKGAEVGLPPITALSTIAVINNRPCIWGDGAVALCQAAGSVEWVKQHYEGTESADDWAAVYTIKRKGQAEPYIGRFSVKDAKRANLWNNPRRQPWVQYPQRMLMARARAYALREGFADCLNGLSIAEEVQDIPQAPAAKPELAFLDDDAPPAIEASRDYRAEMAACTTVTDLLAWWDGVPEADCDALFHEYEAARAKLSADDNSLESDRKFLAGESQP